MKPKERRLKPSLSCLLIAVLLVSESAMGVNADQAVYVGGTANLKQGTKGVLDASNEKIVKFDVWETPYDKITALDYGQHVGRHWAYAALGLYGVLPILLAKKRYHFLTVEYSDDTGKTQAAILKLEKNRYEAC